MYFEDIAVDFRLGSPTFGKHINVELDSRENKQLFVPRGFSVLSSDALVMIDILQVVKVYDMMIKIDWEIPINNRILSKADQELPSFNEILSPFDYNNKLY